MGRVERLRIVVSKTAVRKFENQAVWYKENCGQSFEATFRANILETIAKIAETPTAGLMEEGRGEKNYRSYLAHPKCRIIYHYNSKTLYIDSLRFNAMSR